MRSTAGLAYNTRALRFLRENNKVFSGKEVDNMSVITIILIALVIISVKRDIVKIVITKIKSNKD